MSGNLIIKGIFSSRHIKKFNIVKRGNFLFYNLNKNIYKLNLESNETTIIYDNHVKCLNIVEDTLYFVDIDREMRLFKSNLNGDILEELYYKEPRHYEEVRYIEPYLYIHDRYYSETISRVNIRTNCIENLPIGNPISLFVHDNYAYHSGGDDFCLEKIHITFTDEVNLDNCKLNTTYKEHNILYYEYPSAPYKIKDHQIICDCQHAHEITLKNEWVFFLLHNNKIKNIAFNLFRLKKDGSNLTKLCECNMINIVIHDYWIYFINRDANDGVYRINLDGSETQLIDSSPSCNLHIIEDELIYFNKHFSGEIHQIHDWLTDAFLKLTSRRTGLDYGIDMEIPIDIHEIMDKKTDDLYNLLDEKSNFTIKILKLNKI